MIRFAIIFFVVISALAGKIQLQDVSCKQISCNSTSITNGNPSAQNPIIFQDSYIDNQDTNDLDVFGAVSDLPDSSRFFKYSETRIFIPFLPALQLIQIGEHLLDLPPPSLSI